MYKDWNTDETWKRWLEEHYQDHPRPPRPIHAIARITLRRTEDGGRINPVTSGYRGQFFYDDHDWDANYIFASDDWIQPGETAEAIIQFLSPEAHSKLLFAS